MRDLHLDRLVAALLIMQRLGDHAVAARAAEAAGAIGRQFGAIMSPQPVQRQLGGFADASHSAISSADFAMVAMPPRP